MLGLGVRVMSNIEQNGVLGFTGKGCQAKLELPNPLRRFFKEIRNLCRGLRKTENGSSEVT